MPVIPAPIPREVISEPRRAIRKFLKWRFENKFTFNFIAMLVFLVTVPLVTENLVTEVFLNLLIFVVLFVGVHAISGNRIQLIIGLILAIGSIITSGLFDYTGIRWYHNTSVLIMFVFFVFLAISIFYAIMCEKEITRDTIFGGISVYFLLGVSWAFGIMYMQLNIPSSFAFSQSMGFAPLSEFIGYSFSILTTTGNYPVSAISPTAKMVSMFEMILGNLYIAILVSWMVGRFLADRRQAS